MYSALTSIPFKCSDVNAFLTLAATSHLLVENAIEERISQILEAAKSGTGKVPVQLCTGVSCPQCLKLTNR